MANTGKATKPWDETTTYERLPDEPDEAWNSFVLYRDMGSRVPGKPGGRSIENVRLTLGKDASYARNLREWSRKYDWGRRARKYDDQLELQNRKKAERHIPYWQEQRQRSHRQNIRLARDIRKRVRQMLEHPITMEEVKDVNGREVVFLVPARWTYATVAALAKTAAELDASTIQDGLMLNAENDAFDPSTATIEQLRDFITKHTGKKPSANGDGEG
jgi:hypothetical protein